MLVISARMNSSSYNIANYKDKTLLGDKTLLFYTLTRS
jgi:hypothetical protein